MLQASDITVVVAFFHLKCAKFLHDPLLLHPLHPRLFVGLVVYELAVEVVVVVARGLLARPPPRVVVILRLGLRDGLQPVLLVLRGRRRA